jgi:2-phospho-L-lactate/phosphoenolpyruvate guanylyltransferase
MQPVHAWSVVVPVKDAGASKSRLTLPDGIDRAAFARALARDTITALLDVEGVRVVVVSSDAPTTAWADSAGALVVADPGSGLNEAIAAGLARIPPADRAAVVLGDLPCLHAQDVLAAAEACAPYDAAYVPDHRGTGTVLLAGIAGRLRPRFGPDSARRHGEDATRLELNLPRLRQDLDDLEDLERARNLGLGPFTLAVLHGAHANGGRPAEGHPPF